MENEDLGEPVPIGELAHNVGWGDGSPRGESGLDEEQRRAAENLVLACRNCHRPVDDGGVARRYTIEELIRRKQEHENRIRFLTEIGGDRAAFVVRMVGHVRGTPPELSRGTVLSAATAAGVYPQALRGSHWEDVDLDLRPQGHMRSRDDFERCVPQIRELVCRVHDGVRSDAIERVAVFAFSRIPLLVELGARLDDKLQALIFQRQRRDDGSAWTWPSPPAQPVRFEASLLRRGQDQEKVALIVNLSGTITLEELPATVQESHTIYVIRPVEPAESGPEVIASRETLANFESLARRFLALVEADHGKVRLVELFPAVPVSAAITIGRVRMPDVPRDGGCGTEPTTGPSSKRWRSDEVFRRFRVLYPNRGQPQPGEDRQASATGRGYRIFLG